MTASDNIVFAPVGQYMFACRRCDVRWNKSVLGEDCWHCHTPGVGLWELVRERFANSSPPRWVDREGEQE